MPYDEVVENFIDFKTPSNVPIFILIIILIVLFLLVLR